VIAVIPVIEQPFTVFVFEYRLLFNGVIEGMSYDKFAVGFVWSLAGSDIENTVSDVKVSP
jgi:hypothetical protein